MFASKKILFTLSFLVFSFLVKGQLTASFTQSPSSGCAPMVVNFTNTSTGATSYSWTLGNNATSTQINPSTSYLSAGTYTVTLTAYNGNNSSTATATITVYPIPTVAFFANDTIVCPGLPVSFTSTSNPNTSGLATYSWNFGDGTTSAAQNPTHIFPGQTYYSITLTVTNSQGCISTLVKNAYIHEVDTPIANFSALSTGLCHPPAIDSFIDSSSGTGPLTYLWQFGDGQTSILSNPSHTYNVNGNYNPRLIVTDANGCKDTLTRSNYIHVETLTASFTSPASVCAYQNIFLQVSNPNLGTYWDFGDGQTSTATNPVHEYSTGGTYTITLVINDGQCFDTITNQILIHPSPAISFTSSPVQPCTAPVNIQFNTSVPANAASYQWIFGDNGSTVASTQANPTHTYSAFGYYPVTFIVTDSFGCSNLFIDTVKIRNLLARINPNMNSANGLRQGCAPKAVDFSVRAYTYIPYPHPTIPLPGWPYPYVISTYSWDFGDGSPVSHLDSLYHTYTNPGVYQAIVTITDNGCTAKDTVEIDVGSHPVIDSAKVSPYPACPDDMINFHASVTGLSPLEFWWRFYDNPIIVPGGGLSIGINDSTPAYHYVGQTGTYHPTLTVYNYNCPSDTITLTVKIDSPSAYIGFKVNCQTRLTVQFYDTTSVGGTSHIWTFGDGTAATTQKNPLHTFPSLGYYDAYLSEHDSVTGCTNIDTLHLHLFKDTLSIFVTDTAICRDDTLNLVPVFPNNEFGYGYVWLNVYPFSPPPGATNGPPAVYNAPFPIVEYDTVKLVAIDSDYCADTVYRIILVAKPVDTFAASPLIGCEPALIHFYDSSTFLNGTYIANYAWTFGDGNSMSVTAANTSHTYNTVGVDSVQEIITDNIGCKDTSVRYLYITIDKAHASFSVSNQFPCIGDNIFFTNLSYNNIVSSHWNFGNGDTSLSGTPTYTYNSTGNYTITLTVTDTFGCKDTLSQAAYIQVTKPHASFTMNDSTGVCIPLTVVFTNTSTGASTYLWNLGNGNNSAAYSPSNSYTQTGYDTIMLMATNSHGCSDTAYGHTIVYGYAGALTYTPLTGCPPMLVNFTANVLNVPYLRWDFSDGVVSPVSSSTSTSHIYTTPGAYVPKLIMSDSAGCHVSSIGLDTIKVDSITIRFTLMPAFICIHDIVQFTDSSSSMFSTVNNWQWQFNDGTGSNLPNPQHQFDSTGSQIPVTLIAGDGIGCHDTLIKYVTVYPLPIITAGGDTTICAGDAAPLWANGALSYNWTPAGTLSCSNCQAPQASPGTETEYYVTGTDAQGCKNTDSVAIKTKTTISSKTGNGGEICQGKSIELSDSGALSYTWYPTESLNDNKIATPIATPNATTTYMAIAQTGSCLPDTNYETVIVDPLPKVNAGSDQTIIIGSSTILQASGTNAKSYVWTPSSGLSCDTCSNPTVNIQQTTTYTVTAYSRQGCIDSAKVTVNVLCDHSQVFVPNTFTPNGDGQNDVFYPRGVGLRKISTFRIYDRWGEMLFERKDIELNDESNGWDGSYKGSKPRPDVYVYSIEAVCESGETINWKGDVSIIR